MPERNDIGEKPNSRTQAQKFADLARELECDESEEGFDERLRGVARVPPKQDEG